MHEFDTYISSVVSSLKISKKKKEELTEEFLDHLKLLKLEFKNKGITEAEAIQRAIERFGESNSLNKKLYNSLSTFRNLSNVLFGVLISLLILLFCYIPTFGLVIAFRDYEPATKVAPLALYTKFSFVLPALLFIPFGYFAPIILNRVRKIIHWILTFSIFGISIGACYSLAMTSTLNVAFLLIFLGAGLLGGMSGYIVLLAVNRLNMRFKIEKAEGFTQM